MELSVRTQLKGTVTNVTLGAVMAEVMVDIGNNMSAVARRSGRVEAWIYL